GRLGVDVTSAKTLAAADQGVVQNVIGDVVITLPATAAGLTFTVRNGGQAVNESGPVGAVHGGAEVAISPAAADQIIGLGLTPADDTDLESAGEPGDEVTLVGNGGTGWHVTAASGTWTQEEGE